MPSFPLTCLVLFTASALAQTSLYIPGFDPQPISADILGVDSQGRTSWALHPGTQTDTAEDPGFVGTATLVEGPTDVSFTYAYSGLTIGLECSLSSDLAICSSTSGTVVLTESETASRMVVQVGTTASPAPTGSDPSPTPGSSQPSQSSQPSRTSGNTSSAPNPTSSTSSAQMLTPYFVHLFISTLLLFALA